MLRVENLTKIYGQKYAINDVNFTAQGNEIIGFLGPNGAGKSTTMKIITGSIFASNGNVLFEDKNIRENFNYFKSQIGYLPENNPLHYNMYVKEYLEYTSGIYLKNSADRQKAIKYAIDVVGLGPEQNKKIGSLSKGYKQRTGLASALCHNPKILILDEPTTGLDPNQILSIRELIKLLGKEKTIILSTHIMQEAEAICSRALIINQGKLIADHPIEQLKNLNSGINLRVEFTQDVSLESLSSIEGVSSVKKEDDAYIINVVDKDVRKNIFSFAVSNNLCLVEIKIIENSLEKIFSNLTKLKN